MSTINKGSADEKIGMVFGVYDLDKTGKIKRDEMLKVFQAISTGAPPDPNNPIMTPEEKLKVVFAEMDENEDGVISMNEFVKAVKNRPNIIDPLPFFIEGRQQEANKKCEQYIQQSQLGVNKVGSRESQIA